MSTGMEGASEVFELREGDLAVVGDARHFPVLILTWWGEATESALRRYFVWNDAMLRRAEVEDTKVVFVNDARRATRPPATVRRVLADLTDASPPSGAERTLATFLVLDSALVRGAVTAMQWLSRRDFKLVPVPDLRTALGRAIKTLEAAGVTPPASLDPAGYVEPPMPGAAAVG